MDKAKLTEAMKAEAEMSISAGARAIPICPWCAQPNNLKAQRDALLAACEAAIKYAGQMPNSAAKDELLPALRAALELAREPEGRT